MKKAKRQNIGNPLHPDDERTDKEIRNDEMVEGKNPTVVAQIYKKGGKYYCAECNSELPVHQECLTCHLHIDWNRINYEMRR